MLDVTYEYQKTAFDMFAVNGNYDNGSALSNSDDYTI